MYLCLSQERIIQFQVTDILLILFSLVQETERMYLSLSQENIIQFQVQSDISLFLIRKI